MYVLQVSMSGMTWVDIKLVGQGLSDLRGRPVGLKWTEAARLSQDKGLKVTGSWMT